MSTSLLPALHRTRRDPDPDSGASMTSGPRMPAGATSASASTGCAAGQGFDAPGGRSRGRPHRRGGRGQRDAPAGSATARWAAAPASSTGRRAPVLLLAPGSAVEVVAETRGDGRPRRRARRRDAASPAPHRGRPTSSSRRAATGVTERRIHHLLPPTAAGRPAHPLRGLHARAATGRATRPTSTTRRTRHGRPTSRSSTTTASRDRRAGPSRASTRRTGRSTQSFAPGDGDVILVPRGYHPVGAAAGLRCLLPERDGWPPPGMAFHPRQRTTPG